MADAYLWTLHALTLRQLANEDQLREIVDQPPDDLRSALEKAVGDKTVIAARGSYMITPEGREVLERAYPEWFASLRSDPAVAEAFEKFESGVNKQVLNLTTEWQTVNVDGKPVVNDHGDADYDGKIIAKLGATYDRTVKVLDRFAVADPTVARFLSRLGEALTRAEAGEIDYVSGVRVASFHTVWFQMHEHLLRVMGRERPE